MKGSSHFVTLSFCSFLTPFSSHQLSKHTAMIINKSVCLSQFIGLIAGRNWTRSFHLPNMNYYNDFCTLIIIFPYFSPPFEKWYTKNTHNWSSCSIFGLIIIILKFSQLFWIQLECKNRYRSNALVKDIFLRLRSFCYTNKRLSDWNISNHNTLNLSAHNFQCTLNIHIKVTFNLWKIVNKLRI